MGSSRSWRMHVQRSWQKNNGFLPPAEKENEQMVRCFQREARIRIERMLDVATITRRLERVLDELEQEFRALYTRDDFDCQIQELRWAEKSSARPSVLARLYRMLEQAGISFEKDREAVYYEKLIRVALGEKVDFPQNSAVPNASMLLRSDKDGVIKSQRNDNSPDPDIYEVQFDYEVGDPVKKFHVGPNRIGHVITKGSTLKEATQTLEEALKNIEIRVE